MELTGEIWAELKGSCWIKFFSLILQRKVETLLRLRPLLEMLLSPTGGWGEHPTSPIWWLRLNLHPHHIVVTLFQNGLLCIHRLSPTNGLLQPANCLCRCYFRCVSWSPVITVVTLNSTLKLGVIWELRLRVLRKHHDRTIPCFQYKQGVKPLIKK